MSITGVNTLGILCEVFSFLSATLYKVVFFFDDFFLAFDSDGLFFEIFFNIILF